MKDRHRRLPARLGHIGLALLAAFVCNAAQGQALKPVTVVRGLSHPWGLAFLPAFDTDGRMLVTERDGRVRLANTRGDLGTPLEGVPEVDARGQGGLLDIVLDPKFSENRWIYLSYSEPAGRGTNSTAVARARLEANGLQGRARRRAGDLSPIAAFPEYRAFRFSPRVRPRRQAVRHAGRSLLAA